MTQTYVERILIEVVIDDFENWIIEKTKYRSTHRSQTSQLSQMSKVEHVDVKTTRSRVKKSTHDCHKYEGDILTIKGHGNNKKHAEQNQTYLIK